MPCRLVRLRKVTLLAALETERVRDALLFVAVETSAILLVALILEATRLKTEHLRQHHAD